MFPPLFSSYWCAWCIDLLHGVLLEVFLIDWTSINWLDNIIIHARAWPHHSVIGGVFPGALFCPHFKANSSSESWAETWKLLSHILHHSNLLSSGCLKLIKVLYWFSRAWGREDVFPNIVQVWEPRSFSLSSPRLLRKIPPEIYHLRLIVCIRLW